MGNCFSPQQSGAETLRNLVERPGDPEIVLTADTINRGLREVARLLSRSGQNITIVAVGGAVNTLYLRSRAQTTDVDFFYNTRLRDPSVTAIVRAAQQAARVIQVGDTWLNNHTAVFISEGVIGQLYREAQGQNVVIFQENGLTVLAAPWEYALSTKIDRLSKGAGARDKDLSDAVAYLRQVTERLGRAVTQEEVYDWFQRYGLGEPDNEVLTQLEIEYHDRYGDVGIELPGQACIHCFHDEL